jgi:sensitive to high expression protein 9
MSLIRSEHINDQAIRVAKESVVSAEAALEEARTQLEKRERAQYHEEQIWSDTIRRNSTWVTFVLMGVNIFLLLLSLAILEPWRRRRMVREIKDVLATQRPAIEAAPNSLAPTVAPSHDVQDISAIEEEIDRVAEADDAEAKSATPTISTISEELSTSKTEESPPVADSTGRPETLESVIDPLNGVATPGAVPLTPAVSESLPQASREKTENAPPLPKTWQDKAAALAEEVVSHRVISMRRIDYTTAILQGAAAGALITAAIIGLFGQN